MTDRLDAGRVHETLMDQAWLQLPERDREREFIRLIEECLEPDIGPATARVNTTLHLTLAGWLLVTGLVSLFAAPNLWFLHLASIALGATAAATYYRKQHKERP